MIAWVLAAAAAAAQPADGAAALRQLELVYQQSCAERAYGSYGDMCEQMRREIRAYQRVLKAEARKGTPAQAVAAAPAEPATPPTPLIPEPPATASAGAAPAGATQLAGKQQIPSAAPAQSVPR